MKNYVYLYIFKVIKEKEKIYAKKKLLKNE